MVEDPESARRFGVEPPTGLLLAGSPGTGKTMVAKVLAAGRRGSGEVHDTQVNQLLAEIDGVSGQRGVFIVGATNRPDQLDPALLRGGRLSRTIVLGLPDEAGRLAVLKLHTARMPTVGVRLDELARDSDGRSPADLRSVA